MFQFRSISHFYRSGHYRLLGHHFISFESTHAVLPFTPPYPSLSISRREDTWQRAHSSPTIRKAEILYCPVSNLEISQCESY